MKRGLAAVAAVGIVLAISGCAYLKDLPEIPNLPDIPDIDIPPAPSLDGHRAAFLLDNAAGRQGRVMNCLSQGMSDADFQAIVNRTKGWNNRCYVFVANAGDGPSGYNVTSMYKGAQHAGEIDPNAVALMRARLKVLRNAGLIPVPWFFPDDSKAVTGLGGRIRRGLRIGPARLPGAVTGASALDQKKYLGDAARELGDLFGEEIVLGLELDEYWGNDEAKIRDLTAELHRLFPGKDVGHHYTSWSKWDKAVKLGADTLYAQYGFGQSPAQVAADTRTLLGKVGGRVRVIAAEYHKSSDSAQAKAIGSAAAGAGAAGTGNGRE